jgi:hypothetical protein
METSIDALKQDSGKSNSQEIDNIINQIQQDNTQIKQGDDGEPEQQNNEQQNNEQQNNEQQNNEQYEESDYTMYDVIYNEVSYPLLVIVLFIILSIPQIDSMLCSYISFICSESGDINFFGILLKSLIMGILFYIFGKYIV